MADWREMTTIGDVIAEFERRRQAGETPDASSEAIKDALIEYWRMPEWAVLGIMLIVTTTALAAHREGKLADIIKASNDQEDKVRRKLH